MVDKTIDYFGILAAAEGHIEEPRVKSKKKGGIAKAWKNAPDILSWGSLFQESGEFILSSEYIEENWGNLFCEGPSVKLTRVNDEPKIKRPYKDENGKRIRYPSPNGNRKRVRDYFKQDNRKDVTSTKSSYFSVNRQLTDEEWKNLNEWRVSPEGKSMSFKRGDKIDSMPNKFFYSYTRAKTNGETWRYEKGFTKPLQDFSMRGIFPVAVNEEGRMSYFNIGRRLTPAEYAELTDWRLQNDELAWKNGDVHPSSADLIFNSYFKIGKNGEKWDTRDKYRAPVPKKVKIISDPLLKKITNLIRSNISRSFRQREIVKEERTVAILGISFEGFKAHIESLFEPWMSWGNYGHDKTTKKLPSDIKIGWQLDHIVPVSTAKTREEVYRLNHYLNFQPMCAYENVHIKAGKINYSRNPKLHQIFMFFEELIYPSGFKAIPKIERASKRKT